MSKTGTTRVTVKPGEVLPRGKTDWARVNAMTDEEVLAAARSDLDAQPLGPEELAKMRRVSPDGRASRRASREAYNGPRRTPA